MTMNNTDMTEEEVSVEEEMMTYRVIIRAGSRTRETDFGFRSD